MPRTSTTGATLQHHRAEACTLLHDSDTLPPSQIRHGRTELAVAITEERPDAPDAAALIGELDAHLAELYAVESRHGFSVQKLLRDGVRFFVARDDGRAAGCGGVLLIGREYAEIKRMYVRPAFRGRGVGRLMLDHLIAEAGAHGLTVIRLETGIHQREAIALYERAASPHRAVRALPGRSGEPVL